MFEIRKIKKDKWLIILLVGLLLVVIAMPVSDIKSDQTQDEQQVQKAENASEDTYTDALETRLENALAKVEGVGNVKVMITLASSSEKDQEMTSEVQEGESGGKNTSSSETAVYANGNGEETPYVKQELSPRIEGVLVIADGGDNAIVIENITEAVQALFGVDTHKIKVMKHN